MEERHGTCHIGGNLHPQLPCDLHVGVLQVSSQVTTWTPPRPRPRPRPTSDGQRRLATAPTHERKRERESTGHVFGDEVDVGPVGAHADELHQVRVRVPARKRNEKRET
jgi:hypothetical protein